MKERPILFKGEMVRAILDTRKTQTRRVMKNINQDLMPRWASRITLEIVNVRVERLRDISEGDAIAEGIEESGMCFGITKGQADIFQYKALWEHINDPVAWENNPWVWVIEFKMV